MIMLPSARAARIAMLVVGFMAREDTAKEAM